MTITTIALIMVAVGSVLSLAATPANPRRHFDPVFTMVRGAGVGALMSAILLLIAILAGVKQP